MSLYGAALQSCNNEIIKYLEEMHSKRNELHLEILQEEVEKQRLEHEIEILMEQLARVDKSLAVSVSTRKELDKIIAETEAAYLKIVESSQTLLSVLKRELSVRTATSPASGAPS